MVAQRTESERERREREARERRREAFQRRERERVEQEGGIERAPVEDRIEALIAQHANFTPLGATVYEILLILKDLNNVSGPYAYPDEAPAAADVDPSPETMPLTRGRIGDGDTTPARGVDEQGRAVDTTDAGRTEAANAAETRRAADAGASHEDPASRPDNTRTASPAPNRPSAGGRRG